MSNQAEAMMQDKTEGAQSENEALRCEIDRLHDLLIQIGNIAHNASTGPAVPDVLWEIRGMAYGGVGA